MPERAASQTKIEELESIRGISALLVVFYHIPKWNPLLDIGIINNGYLMVDLFFVLSGFVIFTAYADNISTKADLLRFQVLRFGRLYPVHILFLLVFSMIEITKYFAEIKFGLTSPNRLLFQDNNLDAFIKNILLVQAVFPNQPLTFNYPAWSISVEFYTYLVFGLCILFFKNAKTVLFGALAATAFLMLVTEFTFGFDSMLRCIAGFFIGCLTASATRNAKVTCPAYVSLAVFVTTVVFLQLKTTKDFDLAIFFLTSGLIASLILSPAGLLKTILNVRALTWLGAVSYSVYMSHAAIEWAANQVIRVILRRPEVINAAGKSIPQLSTTDTLIAWCLITASVLLISAFVYTFIEKPLRAKSRGFVFRRLKPENSS